MFNITNKQFKRNVVIHDPVILQLRPELNTTTIFTSFRLAPNFEENYHFTEFSHFFVLQFSSLRILPHPVRALNACRVWEGEVAVFAGPFNHKITNFIFHSVAQQCNK